MHGRQGKRERRRSSIGIAGAGRGTGVLAGATWTAGGSGDQSSRTGKQASGSAGGRGMQEKKHRDNLFDSREGGSEGTGFRRSEAVEGRTSEATAE